MTIAEHIEAAIADCRTQQTNDVGERAALANRDFAIAVTHLETARMFATRGLARQQGVYEPRDLQRTPKLGHDAEPS